MSIGRLAAIAILLGDPAMLENRDHLELEANGWIPLGVDRSGKMGWTTLARGLQGAVTTAGALKIQREEAELAQSKAEGDAG